MYSLQKITYKSVFGRKNLLPFIGDYVIIDGIDGKMFDLELNELRLLDAPFFQELPSDMKDLLFDLSSYSHFATPNDYADVIDALQHIDMSIQELDAKWNGNVSFTFKGYYYNNLSLTFDGKKYYLDANCVALNNRTWLPYKLDGKVCQLENGELAYIEDCIEHVSHDYYIRKDTEGLVISELSNCGFSENYSNISHFIDENGVRKVCASCECRYNNNWVWSRPENAYVHWDKIKSICGEHYYVDRLPESIGWCERCSHAVYDSEKTLIDINSNKLLFCSDCIRDKYSVGGYAHNNDVDELTFDDPSNRDTNLHIGFELEVNSETRTDCEQAVYDAKHTLGNVFCKHDGSISNYINDYDEECKGVEIVSHPMVKSHYENGDIETMLRLLRRDDYCGEETGKCGLHFHVDREYLPNARVITLLNMFCSVHSEIIKNISRRLRGHNCDAFGYCQAFDAYDYDSYDYLIDDYDDAYVCFGSYAERRMENDRYRFLNLTNSGTIEFRFFRSTLNYEEFMASYHFIYDLVNGAIDMERAHDNDTELFEFASDFDNWRDCFSDDVIEYIDNNL